jgi:hypothetical protein
MPSKQDYLSRIIKALEKPYKDGITTEKLMEKVGVNKENTTEKRIFYNALKALRNSIDTKVEYIQIGRKKINYLLKNKDLVIKKWDLKETSENVVIDLEIRKDHTYDIKENVIKPLFNRFKNISYGWEFSSTDKKERKNQAKMGAFYGETYWGGEKGMHIHLYKTVKSSVLLDDYFQNHFPFLAKLIEQFDNDYNIFWKRYFEIHNAIREIIYKIMKLPITMYDPSDDSFHKKNKTSVTTNLQFEFADLIIYGNIFEKNYYLPLMSIKEYNDMYEFWSLNELPKKCYIRINKNGRNKENIRYLINEQIKKISKNIKKSEQLKQKSNEIQKLRTDLWKQQYEILRHLEKELHKKIIDGICDFCMVQNNFEKDEKGEEFKLNVLHDYFHDKI